MNTDLHTLPAHVPPELAYPFVLTRREVSYVDPFAELIPQVHQGPPIFWGTNIFAGANSGGWVIRRYQDLKQVYENTTDVIKRGNTQFSQMIGDDWDLVPSELDPPVHAAFRNALNPLYSPKKMAELENKVRDRARELIGRFKDGSGCDFIQAFAVPFPVSIFLDLVGLPQERMGEFLEWENALIHAPTWEARGEAVRLVKTLLEQAIDARIENPSSDLLSQVLKLTVDGRPWSRKEVFGHAFGLFLGGLDTVTANLGLHFYHLARHPDLQHELRAHPERAEIAISELMRAYAAVTTHRLAVNDFSLHGITIKAGDRIALSTPLGSNDPEVFPEPQKVDINRRPAHLSFGFGIHRCLGNHLARRELYCALQEFLSAVPEFRIAQGFRVPFMHSSVIHVNELQLRWR